MAWTTPTIRSTGDLITASIWNTDLVDNLAFLHDSVPSCRVYNSANISIANNTDTALTFDTERWDNDGIHSTTTSTGRLTCVTPGKYLIGAQVDWATGAGTNPRKVWIRLNGSTIIGQAIQPNDSSGGLATQTALTVYNLSAGDYVEALVRQTSGGALNVLASASYSPEFWMHRIG